MRGRWETYRRHRNLFREWELLKKKTLLIDCFVYKKNDESREVDMIYIPVLGIVSLSLLPPVIRYQFLHFDIIIIQLDMKVEASHHLPRGKSPNRSTSQ
jgi:hypothetical protein